MNLISSIVAIVIIEDIKLRFIISLKMTIITIKGDVIVLLGFKVGVNLLILDL